MPIGRDSINEESQVETDDKDNCGVRMHTPLRGVASIVSAYCKHAVRYLCFPK